MDPKERLDLTSAERAKQERSLAELFGGIDVDDMDRMLLRTVERTSDWCVYSPDDKLTPKGRKYEIQNGDVKLDFNITQDLTTLTWLSSLPYYLRPGSDNNDFSAFTDFVFGKLILKINGQDGAEEYTGYYNQLSKTKIVLKEEEGFPRIFDMETASDYLDLQRAFTDNPDRIRSIVVEGIPNHSEWELGFIFALTYPDYSNSYANIALSLPLNTDGIKGWNKEVLGWVLDNHKFRNRLMDKDASVRTLYEEINSRAVDAFYLASSNR